MSADRPALPTLTEFLREHIVWILGLVPFALAGMRILIISQGNVEVLTALLLDLNVVALVLGTLLPIVPTLSFWAIVYWFERRRRTTRADQSHPSPMASGWIGLAVGLILSAASFFTTLPNIGLLVFFLVARGLRYVRDRRRHGEQFDDGAHIRLDMLNCVVLAIVGSVVSIYTMWIPTEVINIKGHQPEVEYVLSSDREWTTHLAAYSQGNGRLHIDKTSDVESRRPCSQVTRWFQRPIITFTYHPAQSPQCPPR